MNFGIEIGTSHDFRVVSMAEQPLEFVGLFFNKYSIRIYRWYYHNNRWCFLYTYTKPRESGIVQNNVNPFPRWKRNLTWKIALFCMKLRKEQYKQCQGCGEGISEYRIKDPNKSYNTGKRFNCCSGCVNFYDMHGSAKKIKRWKDGKAVTR